MAKNDPKSKSNTGKIVMVVVGVIVIVLIVWFLSASHSSGNGYNNPYQSSSIAPQIYTLTALSQGDVFSINPGSSQGINFTIPQGAYSINITGSYSSQGKVEVAILTPAQYGAFTQNKDSITSSSYYYGDTGGATLDTSLSAGQYTLVFYDPGILTQDTVTVVNPIIIHYTD